MPGLTLAKPATAQHRALQRGHLQPREQALQTAEEAARSCVNPTAGDGEAAASLRLAHSFPGSDQREWPEAAAAKEPRWDGEGTHRPQSHRPCCSQCSMHGHPLASRQSYNFPSMSAKEKQDWERK